jgi:DNA-directed RNA polymerase omega subunit
MPATQKTTTSKRFSATPVGPQRSGMDSDFRLVIVAALRTKQLLHGAAARIAPDPLRRKNTSVALEEIKRGLVHFSTQSREEGNAE